MNQATFDRALMQLLGDGAQEAYSLEARSSATVRSLLEYSRYRPCLRRYGTGNLCSVAAAGAATIDVVGGPFRRGDIAVLDAFGDDEETVTVASAVVATSDEEGGEEPTAIVRLTLSAALQYDHPDGTTIARRTLGLALAVGQDTYKLPADWIRPDQDSFDAALGMGPASVEHRDAFYDASYDISSQLSGIGVGASSNWGMGSYGGYPINGNPYRNPNGFVGGAVPGGVGTSGSRFRFLKQSPPLLVVSPAPGVDNLLDFYYYGCHTIGTAPDADREPILAYAAYAACEARAGAINEKLDGKIGDVAKSVHHNSAELRALAASHLAKFDRKIRLIPVLMSG